MKLVANIAMIYLVFCGLLYAFQRSLIYFPTTEVHLSGVESLSIHSGQERLKVWTVRPEARDAVIYFGGNAENVASSIEPLSMAFPEHAVYLVNYRGYGGSTGSPTETGLFSDAENLFDHLESRHGRISAVGRSLGSGVAIHLSSVRAVHRLAVVTPYDSIEAIGKSRFGIFPVSLLLQDKYEVESKAASITVPVLALLAEHDRVIPREHSERLIAAFPGTELTWFIVEDTDHNTIHVGPEYYPALAVFMRSTE
jgi:uncharacterized protein